MNGPKSDLQDWEVAYVHVYIDKCTTCNHQDDEYEAHAKRIGEDTDIILLSSCVAISVRLTGSLSLFECL
jgi:hypothetical protein